MGRNNTREGYHSHNKPVHYERHFEHYNYFEYGKNQKCKVYQNQFKNQERVNNNKNNSKYSGHKKLRNKVHPENSDDFSRNIIQKKKDGKIYSPWSREAQEEARKKQLSDTANKLLNKLKRWNTEKDERSSFVKTSNSLNDVSHPDTVGTNLTGKHYELKDGSLVLTTTTTGTATATITTTNNNNKNNNNNNNNLFGKQDTRAYCNSNTRKSNLNAVDATHNNNKNVILKKNEVNVTSKSIGHLGLAENKQKKIQNLLGELMNMPKENLRKVLTDPKIHPKIELGMAQIVKENRLILAQKFRKLAESKINHQQQYLCSQFVNDIGNLIDPDLAVDVCQLPPELIKQISDIFQQDYESSNTVKSGIKNEEINVENNKQSMLEVGPLPFHDKNSALVTNIKQDDSYSDIEILDIKEEPESEDSLMTCTFIQEDHDHYNWDTKEFIDGIVSTNESYQKTDEKQNNDVRSSTFKIEPVSSPSTFDCECTENGTNTSNDALLPIKPDICLINPDQDLIENYSYTHSKRNINNNCDSDAASYDKSEIEGRVTLKIESFNYPRHNRFVNDSHGLHTNDKANSITDFEDQKPVLTGKLIVNGDTALLQNNNLTVSRHLYESEFQATDSWMEGTSVERNLKNNKQESMKCEKSSQTDLSLTNKEFFEMCPKQSNTTQHLLVKEVKIIDKLIHELNQRRFMLFLSIVGLDSFRNNQNMLRTSLLESLTNSDFKLLRNMLSKKLPCRKISSMEKKRSSEKKSNEPYKKAECRSNHVDNRSKEHCIISLINEENSTKNYTNKHQQNLDFPPFDSMISSEKINYKKRQKNNNSDSNEDFPRKKYKP